MTAGIRPDFLGIGAQKAGTTWLHAQMRLHPGIWMPPKKELHYFDRDPGYPSPSLLSDKHAWQRFFSRRPEHREQARFGLKAAWGSYRDGDRQRALWWIRWSQGTADDGWYQSLFEQASPSQVAGEITPAYSMLEPKDVDCIHRLNPRVKLVFMLRDPVERAWSAIRFNHGKGNLDIDLDSPEQVNAALAEQRVTRRSDYELTLETYLGRFPREQILVCFYDAIQLDPMGLLNGVASFLGVAPFDPSSVDNAQRINPSRSHDMPSATREFLLERYGSMVSRLSQRFGGYPSRWLAANGSGSPGRDQPAPVAHP